jgi:transmembrane sensor
MNRLPDEILIAATEWLSRRDHGFTPDDAQAYARWLAADPAHLAAIEHLEPAWQAANRSRHTRGAVSLRDHVEQAVARRRRRRQRVLASTFAAAAAIALAFVLFRPAPAGNAAATVALRPNSQTLPDGSVVQLNADAEIAVAFTPELRTVRLVRGEALFEVAKNPARPFVVDAGTLSVRAVGTAFAVRRASREIGVLVTEGKVAVELAPSPHAAAQPPVMLAAGAMLTVPLAEVAATLPAPRAATEADLAAGLGWRNRRVEFSGTPLAEAVQYFNRSNRVQLALASDEVGALRISGVFWTDDAEAFARALETSLGLTAFPAGSERIVLRR